MKSEKELIKNGKKFYESLEKCPICGGEMIDCNNVIIKKARDATVLMTCSNCNIIIGRYS